MTYTNNSGYFKVLIKSKFQRTIKYFSDSEKNNIKELFDIEYDNYVFGLEEDGSFHCIFKLNLEQEQVF